MLAFLVSGFLALAFASLSLFSLADPFGLAAVVVHVPATSLELHGRRMDDLLQSATALGALLYVPRGEFLDLLKLMLTLLAQILVKRHVKTFAYQL